MSPCARSTDDVVQALCADDPLRAHLGAQWCRRYGRIAGKSSFAATLVYECDGFEPMVAEVGVARQEAPNLRLPVIGEVRLYAMREDPKLRTLQHALASHAAPDVVRYRPGKRCTFAASLAGGHRAFFKTLADDRGRDMWEDATILSRQAAQGSFDFAIAEPLTYDPATRTLAHRALAGVPAVEQLFAAGGSAIAGRIGHALASLSQSRMPCRATFAAMDQLQRSARYAKQFCKLLPHLRQDIDSFLVLAERAHVACPDGPLMPIHGAPHPHQWLVGASLGLVDFDRVCAGPVELDVATFLAELDFELMPAELRASLCDAFLGTYCDRIREINLRGVALYRAHKHFAKAFKTAAAIRMDRSARAAEILNGALALIRTCMP